MCAWAKRVGPSRTPTAVRGSRRSERRQRRAEQRKRIWIAGGSILVVVVVVIAFVLIKTEQQQRQGRRLEQRPDRHRAHQRDQPGHRRADQRHRPGRRAAASARSDFVPASEIAARPARRRRVYFAYRRTAHRSRRAASPRCSSWAPSTARSAPPSAGRWSTSLSRFGTFTGLKTTHSSSTDAVREHAHLVVLRLDLHEQVHQPSRRSRETHELPHRELHQHLGPVRARCRPRRPPRRPC